MHIGKRETWESFCTPNYFSWEHLTDLSSQIHILSGHQKILFVCSLHFYYRVWHSHWFRWFRYKWISKYTCIKKINTRECPNKYSYWKLYKYSNIWIFVILCHSMIVIRTNIQIYLYKRLIWTNVRTNIYIENIWILWYICYVTVSDPVPPPLTPLHRHLIIGDY